MSWVCQNVWVFIFSFIFDQHWLRLTLSSPRNKVLLTLFTIYSAFEILLYNSIKIQIPFSTYQMRNQFTDIPFNNEKKS